ncbi:16S rRNA (guanine(527)-N(7))-methyltransferase RsmG [Candidatus Poribacteria bacterium]|nr:16S rRNA (guanine(527)-N(7))-methyltransferase RsmG [Candidatus Poribacteria bacterium]
MSSSATSTRKRSGDVSVADLTRSRLQSIGVDIDESQAQAFETCSRLLERWRGKVNLTAVTGVSEIVERHFVDSALCLAHIPAGSVRVADVGTGAGFPGVPVAILREDAQVVLFEPNAKKVAFLHHAAASMRLGNVQIAQLRLEPGDVPNMWQHGFDVVLSRFTASLPWLVWCASELVAPEGRLIAYTRPSLEADAVQVAESEPSLSVRFLTDERVAPARAFAIVRFSERPLGQVVLVESPSVRG